MYGVCVCMVFRREKVKRCPNNEAIVLRRGGGDPHESSILAGYYGLNANISFTFQAIKNLYAHPTYLCFGPFCNFFGDFWVYLKIDSFSQRISKIYGNSKF